MMITQPIVLASASPRRSELMELAGIPFVVVPADISEDVLPAEKPDDHVLRLSREKAEAVIKTSAGRFYIGADTVVVLDNKIMGKPKDETDAFQMLESLSGKAHQVITGITVIDSNSGVFVSQSVNTQVFFKKLTHQEIKSYIATGCPMDKAGAYAIQGRAVHFVKSICGSYSNVIGLPMTELYELLQALNCIEYTNVDC